MCCLSYSYLQGLDSLFEKGHTLTTTYSLVSQGCELIHVPRAKFRELADNDTLKEIQFTLRKYPNDEQLCKQFLDNSKWDSYKRELIETIVAEQQSSNLFENSLRNTKRTEYLRSSLNNIPSFNTPPSWTALASPLPPSSQGSQHESHPQRPCKLCLINNMLFCNGLKEVQVFFSIRVHNWPLWLYIKTQY